MAVSKLWPVTVRLATVLDYAANPEKTTKAKSKYSNADYQALRDVVNYVKDGKKTEQELFCQGINCNPSTAREQFVTVKEQFDKPDGIQAYHGYLSFKETDITPELAQHIGMEFANSVWGKRHQVLVTTHLNTEHKEDWLVDEPAADIVRKIYALCLDGRGPLQIAKQLEQEKVLIPSAYYASLGRKTRKQYTHPYAWDQKTVAGILANQQYTGCTVNFMTTTVSYKVHKTVYKPKDEWQIIPNTQPAIIDEDTWKRVQELRENRIRPTATGRTSLFSGKVFCADCGSKLHFCAAKSLNANQEHYRCANYKSGRGNCQIHYIRNVVLEKIVLEAINSLADFVRCYEPVFLYLMAQKDIVSKRTETNRLKTSIESGKRRIQDLDKLIERIYEDQVLGNISAERYARMSVNYENEQRELVKRVDEDEKRLACIEQTSLDLKTLLRVLRSSTAFEELTPTLVNSLIRRIEVHNNDKSGGHCYVRVDIYFTAIGLIDIPTEDEIKSLMEKIQANPQEYRLTA